MFQTFNMGLGLVLIVPPDHQEKALERLADESASLVGEVVEDPDHAVRIE